MINSDIKTKRFLIAIFLSIISFSLCYAVGGSPKAGVVFAVFFLLLGFLDFRRDNSTQQVKEVTPCILFLWIPFVAFFTLCISQFMQNELVFSLPILRVFLGVICCILPICFFLILSLRPYFSVGFSIFLLLLLSSANVFVYAFRGSELCPADFFSIGTAINVANRYSYHISNALLYGWIIFAGFIFFSTGLPAVRILKKTKARAIVALIVVSLCLIFSAFSGSFPTQHFLHGGSYYNGFLLNFTKELEESIVHKPEGYSTKAVADISAPYAQPLSNVGGEAPPDIIVIMDEAYSDLSVIGDGLHTDVPVSPFITGLHDNTTYGHVLTSAYGGGTPNSEYEFLSGNSLLFLKGIVYQQYLREPSYSLVSFLNSLGYQTIAMHPYKAEGWRRNEVWPNLQFDRCMFLEDFPQKDLIRGFVSDREMFDVILDTYKKEKDKEDQPLFFFGVTMQNHSSYDYTGADFQNSVHLMNMNGKYPDVEQYLSLIHKTDSAVEFLLERLDQIDHRVIVVFYGDHQPALDEQFYKEVHGSGFESLDEEQLLQVVPFFIWTNYESSSEEKPLTSLNYLSTLMLKKAGISLPAYNQYLSDVEKTISAMNSSGFYSKSNSLFIPFEKAAGKEKAVLERYWIAEYNSLFDLKNLDPTFFPLSNE